MTILLCTRPARDPKIAPPQLKIRSLNSIKSAANKAALLHNILQENHLDVLAITETWITSSDQSWLSSSGLQRDSPASWTLHWGKRRLGSCCKRQYSISSNYARMFRVAFSKNNFTDMVYLTLCCLLPSIILLCGDSNYPLTPQLDDELSLLLNEHRALIQHINVPTNTLAKHKNLIIASSNLSISIQQKLHILGSSFRARYLPC